MADLTASTRERRVLPAEFRATRAAGATGTTIVGYAAKYNVVSEDLGGFREILLPGCFDLANSLDIICNVDHDDRKMLGRTTSGTLTVETDSIGLKFRCLVPDTTVGRDVCEQLRPRGNKKIGDLSGCSFAFDTQPDSDEWDLLDNTPLRKVVRGALVFDVALVTHPAYPNTEVALRSLAAHRLAHARRRLALAERSTF